MKKIIMSFTAYCCFPEKPCINVERTLDTQLSSFWIRRTHVNISGDTTAAFVFNTFNEWFTNTTIATIKKTLRTTNGKHKIEIDEKILSKYLGDNAK